MNSVSNTIFIYSNPNTTSYVPYENKTFGFKIMHPSDWEVAENNPTAESAVRLIVMFMSPTEFSFNIVSEDLSVPLSQDFYVQVSIKHLKEAFPDISILDSLRTNIGSIPAQTITYTAKVRETDIKAAVTIFVYKDKAYALTYGAPPDKFDSYLGIAQIMASTFRIDN
ncbi:MAG: PsbP-related protein [Syntrophomonas sp.]